ncbi:lactate utilization protein C [Spiribacter sp. C176]|uniref:Lactate utilization protein C n=1 Tax=Spiribacter salilacus TaxID=2664894 RepID=A0A6N7QPF0_9GAMM|nr:LUD domain-containing protein [Spiribacter salilacus]MRH77263.1 lactate utilization protein C [Spiribacter salilacus]
MSQNDRQGLFERLQNTLDANRASTPEEALAELELQLSGEPPRPEWSEPILEHFIERLEAAAGVCIRIADSSQLLEAFEAALKTGLQGSDPAPVGIAPHPALQQLAWPAEWQVSSNIDHAQYWKAAITVAHTGIAESGSIVLPSGPHRPTTLNFLPDLHIVVLSADAVVEYMEYAWVRLRADGALPRTVNIITGPSRTADIEQTLQLGAHGPRQLFVILVG